MRKLHTSIHGVLPKAKLLSFRRSRKQGGILKTPHEKPTTEKNPLSFRIRPHKPMREMGETIEVFVDGEADGLPISKLLLTPKPIGQIPLTTRAICSLSTAAKSK